MKNIEISNIATLPTKYGTFKIQAFKEIDICKEHLAIFTLNLSKLDTPLVRVHSECLTGDALGSLKCDCGEQLEFALKEIYTQGGMLIYHRQEGRNIGLLNKVNAYALQDMGFNTVEANHQLGFASDERTYEMVEYVCEYYGIKKVKLLTNNPLKMESIEGIEVVERLPIKTATNVHNKDYIITKTKKMGHLF